MALAVPEIEVIGYPHNYGNFDFGPVEVYTLTNTVFSITNTGTKKLRINAISFIKEDETWFTIDTSSISSIISPEGSTTITVKFKPTFSEHKSVTVIILSDDEDKNPCTFTQEGSGFGTPSDIPDINVKQGAVDIPDEAPSPIDFGNVEVETSGSKVFSIENNDTGELSVFDVSTIPDVGTAAGEFSVIASSIAAALPEGEKTEFTILFNPKTTGAKSATVTIQNDDPDENPYTFLVQGNGSAIPYPDIYVKQGLIDLPAGAGIYDFGCVQSWTSSPPVTLTIENNGTARPVPDISMVEVLYDSIFDFGPVLLGSSKTETFTIVNNGTANLNITDIINKDPDKFSLDISTVVSPIPPGGGRTTFTITFTPTKDDDRTATIEIHSDDPDEGKLKFKVTAYGTYGPEPDINVEEGNTSYPDGSEFYFPDTMVGTSSAPVTMSIRNNGTTALLIFGLMPDGGGVEDFDLDFDPDSLTVPPGGYFTVTLWFKPTKGDKRDTKLKIESNDPDEEKYEIKLKGEGI